MDEIVLRTGDLVIRPPQEEDAEAVLEAVRETLEELVLWMPWAHRGYALEDALGWVRRARAAHAQGGSLPEGELGFVIEESGRFAGCCGMGPNPQTSGWELGYWVRGSRAGRGIATSVARALAAHALGPMRLPTIDIRIDPANAASIRVAEHAGARLHARVSHTHADGAEHEELLYRIEA